MKLVIKEFGEGTPFVILHGLFGFSDNWVSHAKKLSEYFRVILVDLRNHGYSPWSDEFSYTLMVEDLEELFSDLGLKNAILMGHSMGGKVAMQFAQRNPKLLEKLIVVDMGVKEYPMHHQHILQAFHSIDLEQLTARSQAEAILSQFVTSYDVRQFLLKNLFWKEKGKLAWRCNYPVLEKAMPEILGALPFHECMTSTLFIRGGVSNYVLDEDEAELERYFPDMELVTIQDAGHWVHAEAPEPFMDAVLSFSIR